jgi:hypothetical protein
MPPPALAIRAATPDDAPQILRVHTESIRTLGRAFYTEPEVESWAAGLMTEGYVIGDKCRS